MGAETEPETQPNQGQLDRGASFPVAFDEVELHVFIAVNPGDFGAWTSLIEEVEKTTPDDIGRICQVYDSFLSEFPLCYGYWKKYADHKARLWDISKAVEVYERAVQSASYSVHIWENYCSFGMLLFEDPADVRRLFERGISLVGKDYLSYLLWDKYIEFEYSQKQWGCLAHVYIRTISFPTKKLQSYYESFKIFSVIWEEEIISQNRGAAEGQSETLPIFEILEAKAFGGKEILRIIRDLLDPGAGMSGPEMLKKFLSAGKHFYQIASDMDAKIKGFENRIRRPYFHIKLLDDVQLENWHHYLDFVELQGDFDWAVKLYERCLIPCANYPEFWIRYVEFVEARGGREIANLALARATQVFLKSVPGIHYFCAKYKEQIGDIFGARAAFLPCSPDLASDFIENITRKANMEKRLGNAEAASIIYEEALDMAKNAQNQLTLSSLYDHFSKFIYMASGDIDAARDVLIRGLQDLPHSKFLLQKLIHIEMMHGGQKKIDMIGSIVAQMTAPPTDASEGLSTKEREEISNLFLEFVDLCGTVHEIKKAWECHRKLFPYQMRPTSSNKNASNKISMDKVMGVRDENLGPLPHHASGDDKTEGQKQHPVLHGTPPQKDTNLQSDEPVTDHSQQEVINNDSEDGLEQVESAEVVQEHSRIDAAEDVGLCNSVHEDISTQPPDASIEHATSADQTQIELDHVAEDDLKPLDLDTLSINHQDEETQDSNPAKSSNKAPDIASTDGDHSSSNAKCMQSDMLAHAYTHEQTYSQRRAPTIATFQHNGKAPRKGNRDSHDRHASRDEFSHRRAEAKQLQRRQASAQQNHSQVEAHSQMLVTQGYPYQQQPWQLPPVHQASQQYQAAAAQVSWTTPNMQQQAFASVHQSQQSVPSVSHPQAPTYQYPAQLSQQHGNMHSYSGFNPQMWYYYQQQQQTQLPQQHLHPQVHLQQQQLQEQLQLWQQQQHHHHQINPQQQQQQQQHLQINPQQQQQQQHLQINPQQQQQHLQINPQQQQQQQQKEPQPEQQQHLQINPQQQQQQQQQEPQPQQQQQQLPQPQKLQHQQQLSQQQQISPHIQTWHNYYQQHAVLTQYYANNQYSHQDIGSQGHIAGDPNSEQSGRASSEPQEQVHSSQ